MYTHHLQYDHYPEFLRETAGYLTVSMPYNKVGKVLKKLFHLDISTRVIQKFVTQNNQYVHPYYEQKPPPNIKTESTIAVIQSDGKGIPMICETQSVDPIRLGKGQKRGKKKESIVTSVYTIDPDIRTPETILTSFFQLENHEIDKFTHPKPQNKHIWATLDGKEIALSRLQEQVNPRLGKHIQYKVALADGCPALQKQIKAHFPDFTLILDFIHAVEYLWDVANRLWGEKDQQRVQWVKEQTNLILTGKTKQLIKEFRCLANQPNTTDVQVKQIHKSANYFERNLEYMAYDTYLKLGFPIASGVIEGACRHFVKDRFELSGMRWLQSGAENLLGVRAIAENDDWDEYHLFRRCMNYQRLYLPASNESSFSFDLISSNLPQVV